MSQEARLKLRMQKELKLLLADPPHGISFPFLSSNSDITDLCSIDAQIEGPEDTVYGKGIFKIKIQIPERYPLQPPIVTFATPIYHPNIDNGGRICLDTLNLPPKGTWQPSLNISTVLISIRLLLSEPNPDDGLMCEASREYKYNRQAFDHKARSMTEKFAKAGAGESSCSNQCTETKADSAMVEVKGSDHEPNRVAQEFNPGRKRSLSISQKLSLESNSTSENKDAEQKVPNDNLFLSASVNQMESKRKGETENDVLNEYNPNNEKVNGKGPKSSSETSDRCKDDFDNKENVDPNYLSPLCQHPASSGSSLDFTSSNKKKDDEHKVPNHNLCLLITQMGSKRKREEANDVLNEYILNNEKVNGKGKKLSLKTSDQCKEDSGNKENVDPNYISSFCQHPASSGSSLSQASRNQQLDQQENSNSEKRSSKLCQSQKQPFGSMEGMQTCENVKDPGDNLFISASVTKMESKRKREKENDVRIEYNLNNEKVSGKGRKSSSKTSDRFKDDFDNKENVDPNYLSPLCRNQQLDQHEDGNSANSNRKSSSKLYQSLKQPFGSMESMQTCENVKVLGTVDESYVDRSENISTNKKPEKISSVSRKLSLGLKGLSHRQKVRNTENVIPIHKLPLSKPLMPGKSVFGRKLSLVPSTQQLQQDCGSNQKQQSNQVVQSKQTDNEVKQKGKEEMEEESSISEKVVVLDSEESEGEEQTAPLRMRMPLAARKRLGKWRV